jgi:hypothetical protein
MVFSSILQNDGLKPKIFWVEWRTKHTLSIIEMHLWILKNGVLFYSCIRGTF